MVMFRKTCQSLAPSIFAASGRSGSWFQPNRFGVSDASGAVAPGHCTGEHAFAALREAFGERWVYAGAGVAIDAAAIR